MEYFLKSSSILMMTLGIFFIIIQILTRINESLLYLGIFLTAITAIAGVDIWVLSEESSAASGIFWVRLQHAAACLFILGLGLYVLRLTDMRSQLLKRITIIWSSLGAVPFFTTDILFLADGEIKIGLFYLTFFVPYFISHLFVINFILINKYFRSRNSKRKTLLYHVSGMVILWLCAFLDLLAVINPSLLFFDSATTLGALGYGIAATGIFFEGLIRLVGEKGQIELRLESVMEKIGKMEGLATIGRSTAFVTHEIKNHVSSIKGNLQLALRNYPSLREGEEFARIERTALKLESISKDILNISNLDLKSGGDIIKAESFIKKVIEENYFSCRDRFRINCEHSGVSILGNRVLLERALCNVLKNSLEAGADDISIDLARTGDSVNIRISDNGAGCSEDQLSKLSGLFFTTKSAMGGSGLGLAITKLIVEAHGGQTDFAFPNKSGSLQRGLTVGFRVPLAPKT